MAISPPQTPLHLAAHEGYSQCIEILLNHGAQIRVENTRRVTPVELARGKVMCERVFRNAIGRPRPLHAPSLGLI